MLKVKIIAMGKLTVPHFLDAASDYAKRISRFYSLTVAEPKPEPLSSDPSEGEIASALSKEAEKIFREIPKRAKVYAMCVEGKTLSSEELARAMDRDSTETGEVCFIIGSSHGLAPEVKKRADVRFSVSPMTFPHELFRVMLLEQIYRSAEINSGGKYHK